MKMECSESNWHFDYVRLAWDSGFTFNNSNCKTPKDFTAFGLLDVEQITKERDIAVVEKYLPTLLNLALEENMTKLLEPTFVKVFQISQLSLQYLQFCRKYLDNTIVLLKRELDEYKAIFRERNKNSSDSECTMANMKQNIKELKRQLECPQFSCQYCCKIFYTKEYLDAHVTRRHNDKGDNRINNMQVEADKLQMEIKELKERLNSTEKFINLEKEVPKERMAVGDNELQNKLEKHRQQVAAELNAIKENTNRKYEQLSETLMRRFEIPPRSVVSMVNQSCNTSNEICTQTESIPAVERKDSCINTDTSFEINEQDVRSEVDAIRNLAEERLNTFSQVIDTKVSLSLSQIESKLQMFFSLHNQSDSTADLKKSKALFNENSSLQIILPPRELQPIAAPRRNVSSKGVLMKSPEIKSGTILSDHFDREKYSVIREPTLSEIKVQNTDDESSSSSESESSSSESSEDEMEENEKVVAKQIEDDQILPTRRESRTSTLKDRSLTSLRKALDHNVTDGLQKSLTEVLNQKLRDIGVDPNWQRIPAESYQHASKIVAQQSKNASKKYYNYATCRKKILSVLKNKLAQRILSDNLKKNVAHFKSKNQEAIAKQERKFGNKENTKPGDVREVDKADPLPPLQTVNLPIQSKVAVASTVSLKKRVNFDLESDESSSLSSLSERPIHIIHADQTGADKAIVLESTTSVASSVFEDPVRDWNRKI